MSLDLVYVWLYGWYTSELTVIEFMTILSSSPSTSFRWVCSVSDINNFS